MAFICPFCSRKETKNIRVDQIDIVKVVEHLVVVKMDKGDGESEFHVHGPTEEVSVMIELIQNAAEEAGLEIDTQI